MDNRNIRPAIEETEYEGPPRDTQRWWNWSMTWVTGLVALVFLLAILYLIIAW
jgi:hypothetical protein